MTFLKFYFLLCSLLFTTTSKVDFSQKAEFTPSCLHTTSVQGGSIVITDVIMLIILNNPNDNINTIQIMNVTDQLVLETGLCGNNQCEYDLSSLESGCYTVIVSTEKNDSFSSLIEL
jgi:hypothetical protein